MKDRGKQMAYTTSTQGGRIAGWVAAQAMGLTRMLRRRKIYAQTVRELHALSTRELADLGISRSMITRLALEAARRVD
jgi:uncharacterized protein YjiS (DUF1127 family)